MTWEYLIAGIVLVVVAVVGAWARAKVIAAALDAPREYQILLMDRARVVAKLSVTRRSYRVFYLGSAWDHVRTTSHGDWVYERVGPRRVRATSSS